MKKINIYLFIFFLITQLFAVYAMEEAQAKSYSIIDFEFSQHAAFVLDLFAKEKKSLLHENCCNDRNIEAYSYMLSAQKLCRYDVLEQNSKQKVNVKICSYKDSLTGYIVYYHDYTRPWHGHIEQLAVAPEHRGKYMGYALLDHGVKDLLEKESLYKVSLAVFSGNDRAKKVYKKYGFLEKHKNDYYKLGVQYLRFNSINKPTVSWWKKLPYKMWYNSRYKKNFFSFCAVGIAIALATTLYYRAKNSSFLENQGLLRMQPRV